MHALIQVVELTSPEVWAAHCEGDGEDVKPKKLCVLAFLPNILDSKVGLGS